MADQACRVRVGDQVQPWPPRYWWLKRLSLTGTLFILGILAVRLWWGWVADSRLRARIAEYRAALQPIMPQDFVSQPIPDEENAAWFLKRAAAELKDNVELGPLKEDLRIGVVDRDTAIEFLERNRGGLGLLRQARARPRADWQVPLSSPVIAASPRHTREMRALAKAAFAAAIYHCQLGNDAEAVETIRDGLAVARHSGWMQPGMVPYLTGVAIEALGMSVVEELVPWLRITPEACPSPSESGPATHQQLRGLLDDLLDENWFQQAWERGVYGDRMICLDTLEYLCYGSTGAATFLAGGSTAWTALPSADWLTRFLLAPAWKLEAVRAMENCTIAAGLAQAGYWHAPQRMLPIASDWQPSSLPQALARSFMVLAPGSYERAIQIHFQVLAQSRMAALSLAIRLYQYDCGRRPSTLAELVPDYLMAVPRDPFDPDDGQIRYLPHLPSPVLYSVGLDGIDNGGVFDMSPGRGAAGWDYDVPFFLDHRALPNTSPATRAPASEAVEDDQQIKGAERQQCQQ